MPASVQLAQFRDPALVPVGEKVLNGQRLDRADALALYETADLLGLGSLAAYANAAEERRPGLLLRQSAHQPH